MAKKITVRMLRLARACKEQTAIFRKEWPQGCEVTVETVARAQELGLDPRWAAQYLLSAAAWAEYDRATAAAQAEYDRVTAPARAERNRIGVTAGRAWAEYERATSPALAGYNRVTAAAFVAAWNTEGR